ncbi:putative carbonic anhydrase [Lyophyllum shimeji]|uniref:Carbonic anhydrase n=1 Tax=Lyophyllum shimeji TaxID=47721 RepID=A0A9P3PQI9_LYOSH|nr:putative carbonic anhydrase [Lyophyllum shimeji]
MSQRARDVNKRIQSPINLDKTIRAPPSKPVVKFGTVEKAEFENLGTTVEVVLSAGTVKFRQKEYVLQQFHFHTPSEHRIELEYFSLEIHFVYKAANNATLVLGALFELTKDGSTTALLTVLAASLDEITEPGSVTETGH